MIYRFNADWSGQVLVESVGREWVSVLEVQQGDQNLFSSEMTLDERCDLNKLGGEEWPLDRDTYLQETKGGRYKDNESLVVDNIYTAGHDSCHLELLEQFQTKAYIIVPILVGDKLWGLLGAYENSGPRKWIEAEVNVLKEIGVQVGNVLQETEYINKLQQQSQTLAKAAKRETNFVRLLGKINQIR